MSNLYEQSGVNLKEADKLHDTIKKNLFIKAFAGTTPILDGYEIVTCCDGIGSKIIPLYEKKLYKTIAVDLIAANLNDLICSGAKALGFVDYIAVNKLESYAISEIIIELKSELQKYNCKLQGGETSEIPDLIKEKRIDISGFAIGLLEEKNKLPQNVKEEDIIIGLESSGIHANGFSLIRKLYKECLLSESDFEQCLAPSNIYYNGVSKLVEKKLIKASANITGGGIFSNLNRSIPENLTAKIDYEKIPTTPLMKKLKEICKDEFYEVFNAGCGFCIVADKKNKQEIFEICEEFSPFELGEVRMKK